MLIGTGRHSEFAGSARDSVHNYYERAVFDELYDASERARHESNFMADVACVALNHLPPRYVRYDVDMTFFLSPVEIDEMSEKVRKAVKDALDYVSKRDTEYPVGSKARASEQAK